MTETYQKQPEITDYIRKKAIRLHRYALWFAENPNFEVFNRPLLNVFLSESRVVEELLDFYGAHASLEWFVYRELVAAIKNFSEFNYILLHLYFRCDYYHLSTAGDEFKATTFSILNTMVSKFSIICNALIEEGKKLDVYESEKDPPSLNALKGELPIGHFLHDIDKLADKKSEEAVLKLATKFLHLSTEFQHMNPYDAKLSKEEQLKIYREKLAEEVLRSMEFRIHNLQSHYDTYIQLTPTEKLEPKLVHLRGHITIVYHLLRVATLVSHYYMRHSNIQIHFKSERFKVLSKVFTEDEYIAFFGYYCLAYINLFFKQGSSYCRDFLKEFSVLITKSIPIPNYRGFHVRPSTLVAQIVNHYGAEVKMLFDGVTYNPASPLELFRANEAINRIKRKQAADMFIGLVEHREPITNLSYKDKFRNLLFTLVEDATIVLYDTLDNSLDGLSCDNTSFLEYANDAFAHIMAMGKIDVKTTLSVDFSGDERVISDIQILAENGYGEDRMGKNIPLPKELSYLFRGED